MGKTRKSKHISSVGAPEILLYDANPGRIHGATITSWNGPPEIDLALLFGNSSSKVSVSGGAQPPQFASVNRGSEPETINLSDGTKIIFATAAEPAIADPA